jgi:hypothetical protein
MVNLFGRLRGDQTAARPAEMRTVRLWLMDSAEPVTERSDQARAESLFQETRDWPNAAAAELVGDDDDVLDRW